MSGKTTQEKLEETMRQEQYGRCPYCGSWNVEAEQDLQGEVIKEILECMECDRKHYLIHKLVKIQSDEGDVVFINQL